MRLQRQLRQCGVFWFCAHLLFTCVFEFGSNPAALTQQFICQQPDSGRDLICNGMVFQRARLQHLQDEFEHNPFLPAAARSPRSGSTTQASFRQWPERRCEYTSCISCIACPSNCSSSSRTRQRLRFIQQGRGSLFRCGPAGSQIYLVAVLEI